MAACMAVNYGRPKPVDPLWYRFGWHLHVRCLCGHAATVELQDFAVRRGLPASLGSVAKFGVGDKPPARWLRSAHITPQSGTARR